ncbi:MAG: type IV pilus twitching motility protein PilT [Sedimentisphaerales bacterium]|nr:type IV pilus twitching motility protein PilT [Sedimentisphaerales bacterium]
MSQLQELLTTALNCGASDVHIMVGSPPLLRVHTVLQETDYPVVTVEGAEAMVRELLPEHRVRDFMERRDIDFSAEVSGKGRFRVNAHFQRGSIGIAFRGIPEEVLPLEKLNLPRAVFNIVDMTRGLVLVTGDTGSGKSTTMASVINSMNQKYRKHIITLEDPIEYMLTSNKCAIEQREIGDDCPTFASGLKHALRQDPDVILVGEMRDLETSSAAITAAETGHLVLSTLHTINAPQTIERIIDIYPTGQQNQIRSMLANTLKGVISQTLLKRTDTPGMIPAIEVMLCTSAVRNCIRENRIYELPNVIETSRALGMQSLDTSIGQLYFNGQISREDALAHAAQPEKLERALSA